MYSAYSLNSIALVVPPLQKVHVVHCANCCVPSNPNRHRPWVLQYKQNQDSIESIIARAKWAKSVFIHRMKRHCVHNLKKHFLQQNSAELCTLKVAFPYLWVHFLLKKHAFEGKKYVSSTKNGLINVWVISIK